MHKLHQAHLRSTYWIVCVVCTQATEPLNTATTEGSESTKQPNILLCRQTSTMQYKGVIPTSVVNDEKLISNGLEVLRTPADDASSSMP
jgi:hypothetical protein